MNSNNRNAAPRQAWTDWLLILACGALLALPAVDSIAHIDWSLPPDENRLLAPAPRLTRFDFAGLREYLADTDTYFNDHFGFRKRLIRWCQQWKSRIYRDKSADAVIVGRDGWLYIAQLHMIDHYLCLEQFTPQQLQSWQRLLEKRRDWLAARGIKYQFVVAPDKQTIYPEYLPAWLLKAAPAVRHTKLDQFVEYMKAHSTVEVLDLRPAELAGKQIAPTYLRNDTHWNWFGGFLAARELINVLGRQTPDIPPLRLDDFDWANAATNGGDLAGMLGLRPPEKNFYVFKPKPPLTAPVILPFTNVVRNWSPGDTKKINLLVVNTNLPAQPDLVVFHDSYARPWWQFLGYSFHRIVFIWENKEFNARVIEENHPQIVVNEMLERMFNVEDPDAMMAKDALP